MASRKGCWRRVTGWICMAPRWPQVYLYLYSNLIHLLQFQRHTARASLLFLLGTCVCHIKTLHLQFLRVLPLVPSVPNGTTHKEQSQGPAAPCWSQPRPQSCRQLYFVSPYLPRHKAHTFTKISPSGTKVRYKALRFRNRHLPPVCSVSHWGKKS